MRNCSSPLQGLSQQKTLEEKEEHGGVSHRQWQERMRPQRCPAARTAAAPGPGQGHCWWLQSPVRRRHWHRSPRALPTSWTGGSRVKARDRGGPSTEATHRSLGRITNYHWVTHFLLPLSSPPKFLQRKKMCLKTPNGFSSQFFAPLPPKHQSKVFLWSNEHFCCISNVAALPLST